jgi:UDP-N-acetylmuramate: L-alanyl-gamma-D-glutamyl-meso-diaminopimelate ligase
LLETPEGDMPIEVLAHNNNLAKWICQNMGVDEAEFTKRLVSFKGASKDSRKLPNRKQL